MIKIIYLDEIEQTEPTSIGLGIIELVVGKEETAPSLVKLLTEMTQETMNDNSLKREVVELIEKVVIYKFPKKTYKELEAMFGLTEWKQTQFYQDVKAEGKQEEKLQTIPRLVSLGLSVEQIAPALELSLETVQQAIDNLPKQ